MVLLFSDFSHGITQLFSAFQYQSSLLKPIPAHKWLPMSVSVCFVCFCPFLSVFDRFFPFLSVSIRFYPFLSLSVRLRIILQILLNPSRTHLGQSHPLQFLRWSFPVPPTPNFLFIRIKEVLGALSQGQNVYKMCTQSLWIKSGIQDNLTLLMCADNSKDTNNKKNSGGLKKTWWGPK